MDTIWNIKTKYSYQFKIISIISPGEQNSTIHRWYQYGYQLFIILWLNLCKCHQHLEKLLLQKSISINSYWQFHVFSLVSHVELLVCLGCKCLSIWQRDLLTKTLNLSFSQWITGIVNKTFLKSYWWMKPRVQHTKLWISDYKSHHF